MVHTMLRNITTNFVIAFYSLGIFQNFFILYYSKTHVDFTRTTKQKVLDVEQFGSRYLTAWNMCIQTIYMMMALTYEILLLNKHKISSDFMDKFAKFRGYVFTTYVLPCAFVVAAVFWTFYHIDKESVMPDGLEDVVPSWINHCVHTHILILPIIELVLPKLYIPSMLQAFIGVTVFTFTYNSMFILTYFETGKWMYALYEDLSWTQRLTMIGCKYILALGVCQLGFLIQNLKPEKCDNKVNYKNMAQVTKKLL